METTARSVYILFSRPDTRIGRVIRVFLRSSRYTHVSVSLDGGLKNIYSFARKRYDSPFSGGFTREYPSQFFTALRDIDVKLCRVDLDEQAHAAFAEKLDYCLAHSESLLYNLYDAVALPFHRRVPMRDAFTCVSFAAYLMGMDVKDIGDLETRIDEYTVYEGSFERLVGEKADARRADDPFYFRQGIFPAIGDFFAMNRALIRRMRGAEG